MQRLKKILPVMIGATIFCSSAMADTAAAKSAGSENTKKAATAEKPVATVKKSVETVKKNVDKVKKPAAQATGAAVSKGVGSGKPFIDQLDPEEQRRLMKLYQDNPALYYAELEKIIGQLRKEEAELNRKLGDAVAAFRLASDPVDKKKKLEIVKNLTRQQFFFRLNETEHRIKESEKRLQQLRQLYDARKNSAEAIIDKRVQYLISDPSQRW